MRLLNLLVLCSILACGCAQNKSAVRTKPRAAVPAAANARTNANLIVTPGTRVSGRVASVNAASRFVIATFPLGTMPVIGQQLNVYREGLKVGEIKITGPQRDVSIAGDIITGNCQPGDDIKSE